VFEAPVFIAGASNVNSAVLETLDS